MKPRLKSLEEQVVVITGASSGIGLVTARMASDRGARVVAVARSEDALRRLAEELRGKGREAIHVAADVADEREMRRAADEAVKAFGRIDTWINDAGVSVYGRIEEVALDDLRRLFDTNFWGVVNGSRVALERIRDAGGAIINIGSVVSDRAIPLQGVYAASKHAVKAFTDALRMEIEEAGYPVSVTLIKPGSIATPFPEHAKSYLGAPAKVPFPVYAPDVVAKAILHAAEYRVRDLVVGGGAKLMSASATYTPRITDKFMEATMFSAQKSTSAPDGRSAHEGLHTPSNDLRERGSEDQLVFERSAYTQAVMHPVLAGAILAAGAAGAAFVMRNLGART